MAERCHAPAQPTPRQGLCWSYPADTSVSIVLGLLLLGAAVLKLLTVPGSESVLSTESHTMEAVAEMSLALWLFSGKGRDFALGVTGLSFLSFATVTLMRVWVREPDCGCFGPLHVPPELTFWIDSIAATVTSAMLMARFRRGFVRIVPWIFLLLLTAAFVTVLALRPSDRTLGSLRVGMTWPVPGLEDLPTKIAQGRWVLLIYDPDCHRCVAVAESLAEDALGWITSGKNCRLALLEEGGGESAPAHLHSGIERWVLRKPLPAHQGPILVILENGRIVAIEETWQPPDWKNPTHASWLQ